MEFGRIPEIPSQSGPPEKYDRKSVKCSNEYFKERENGTGKINIPVPDMLKEVRLAPDVRLGIERERVQLLRNDGFDHVDGIETIK